MFEMPILQRALAVTLSVILLAAAGDCAAAKDDAAASRNIGVYYGTDRALLGGGAKGALYGEGRGEIDHGVVSFELRDAKAKSGNKTGDPLDATLVSTRRMSEGKFFASLRDPALPGSPDRIMLVVHGFKRDFDTAAENAARVADFTGFEGRTVLWSWPSRNNAAAYLTDRTSLLWSEEHLASFIRKLVDKVAPQQLVMVAHSLGAKGLTHALFGRIGAHTIASWPSEIHLALLAPDIDVAIFGRDIAPALAEAAIKTTVYTSSNDRALAASSRVNGYPRVGDSSDTVHTFAGVDTIDATRAQGKFLGHSYYRSSSKVADDLRRLIAGQPTAARPGLRRVEMGGSAYWEMVD